MDLQEIEKRLKILEDIEAIRSLQFRYVTFLSEANWDEIANCFAENGVLHLKERIQGKDNIEHFFKTDMPKQHILGKQPNFVVHPIITVEGDKAKGTWSLFCQHSKQILEQGLFWQQGPYDMEYIREKGEWKISLLRWRPNLRC